ncbi:MAG: 16S rRNA (cytosine(1402)-N(4))-methyltransferase [Gammaproteobacteria bacterium]|nr:16S rRNA (cytosine(1402)-N(4))-methyltransferase [Gammaproteobacteria bacterium]|tara:strand:+ start:30489 stop:31427 length:939 start_codon:yes stop_codon:yes gene_type:complete
MINHIPVMKEESIQALCVKKSGIYIDTTFGSGGHSQEILNYLNNDGKLYSIEKDFDAIKNANKNTLSDKRFTLKHGCFSSLDVITKDWGIHGSVNGILFDLGVSSEHLDNPKRGFSFKNDGPLDMRFDQNSGSPAREWISEVSEEQLRNVIKKFGQERYANKIAKKIISFRKSNKIENTHDLVNIINQSVPKNDKNKHNATRTFQAIRIYINQELEVLKNALEKSYQVLAPKGRLVLITYHSLEDRVIKDFITYTDTNLSAPKDLPLDKSFLSKMFNIISKSIKPSNEEISANPRSRSAKLNILEKNDENIN